MSEIAVIGAGIIGLSTAYALALANPNYKITIFADKFSPNTTSDGAAGVFSFATDDGGMRQTPSHLLRKWSTATLLWYDDIFKKEYASKAGILQVSGYHLFDCKKPMKLALWESVINNGRPVTDEELKRFGSHVKDGIFFTTFMCESRRYLPWLMERIREQGGNFVKRKIKKLEELADFDVIVNCSGFGARELCGDKELKPVRGQVLRMEAPWLKHFYRIYQQDSYPVYIYLNINDVVVGGTAQESDDLQTSEEDRRITLDNACKLEPSLKMAKIKSEWVGLRPSRTSVRLEKEEYIVNQRKQNGSKTLKVVHNYGHGPSGVTLHWGCAINTVELVRQCLDDKQHSQMVISKF